MLVDGKDMEIQDLRRALEATTVSLRLTEFSLKQVSQQRDSLREELRAMATDALRLTEDVAVVTDAAKAFIEQDTRIAKALRGEIRGLRKQLKDQIRRKRAGNRICRTIINGLADRNKELMDGMSVLQQQIVQALAKKYKDG